MHIGLIGAGVMGSNLAVRIHDQGYRLQIYERDAELRERASLQLPAGIECHADLAQLVSSLALPRCLLLLIKAGGPVDRLLEKLLPLLDPGDMLVDLGNSHYLDTERRIALANASKIAFVGCGISGGAEGARNGPALMPGGDITTKPKLEPLFQDIAAKFNHQSCGDWTGAGGSGHFVKMVHNGIEYADMQLIAETYHLMRESLSMSCDEIGEQFRIWNGGPLQSYLLEISAKILNFEDQSGIPTVDLILDRAGQKGTGSWTSAAALHYGSPANLLTEAVFARMISSFKDKRVRLARFRPEKLSSGSSITHAELEQALLVAKTLAYCQGFDLMDAASGEHQWQLDLAKIAAGWRAGCIIRGDLLEHIIPACNENNEDGIIASTPIRDILKRHNTALRSVIIHAIQAGVPVPGFSAALAYLDAFQSALLPANLIQAQRDYFGAHGFQRSDSNTAELSHFNWTEKPEEKNN